MKKAFIILALLSLPVFADSGMAKIMDEHIYIIPAGRIDKDITGFVKDKIPGTIPANAKAEVDRQMELPELAYDPSRKQYDAVMMLDEMSRDITIDTGVERAIIITDADLYAPDSDFVLGFADAKRGIAVVSTARLGGEKLAERVLKESMRELGISRGLTDCPDRKCAMYFSNNVSGIDAKRSAFCRDCRDKLRRQYIRPIMKAVLKPLI
ncbi:MAG: archaemetzincin [Candidatus Omnitrophica bacterium]|nr:archaemetzincin [Candidatus Omnitrophota bacterium]